MTCLGQITHLPKIAPTLSPVIVLEEKHKDYATKFLEHRLQLNPQEHTYLFSDALYNQLSTEATSSVHVVNEQQEILYEGNLKELGNLINTINTYAGKKVKHATVNSTKSNEESKIASPTQKVLNKLPDAITLSSEYYLLPTKETYYVHDYMFNQIHQYAVADNKSISLKAIDIDKEALHQGIFGHLKHHRATIYYDEILTQLNQKNITIESVQVGASSLYAIVKVPYPIVETVDNEYALIVKAQYALIELKNLQLKQVYALNAPEGSGYSIDPVSFEVTKEGFQFSLFKTKWDDVNYFRADYKLANNSLDFVDFVKAEVPSFFKKNDLVYEYFNTYSTNQYIFFQYGGTYINKKNGKEISLPKAIVDWSVMSNFKDFQLLAVKEHKKQLKIIYKKADKIYQAVISNKKVLQNDLINQELTSKTLTNYHFLDWESLIVLHSSNEIAVILLEDSLSLQNERGNHQTAAQRHP